MARFAARVSSASSRTRSASANFAPGPRRVVVVGAAAGVSRRLRIGRVRRRGVRLRAEPVLEELRLPGPRLLERVEVVAVAHVDERLAPVVHLRQVVEQVGGRRERHVRPVPDLGRPFLPFRPLDDVGRLERAAHHLLDRLVDPLRGRR
ncbi:MAG: hypothetical protein MZV64_72730 [Ignavibacteriales bacterium]|nr:hypothetical protein [Ignavibacteriales bacterium]